MKIPVVLGAVLAGTLLVGCQSSGRDGYRYAHDGRVYNSYQECRDAKKRARTQGAVIGAVGGAAVGAIAGGNLGESALAAGAGALAGGVIGDRTRNC